MVGCWHRPSVPMRERLPGGVGAHACVSFAEMQPLVGEGARQEACSCGAAGERRRAGARHDVLGSAQRGLPRGACCRPSRRRAGAEPRAGCGVGQECVASCHRGRRGECYLWKLALRAGKAERATTDARGSCGGTTSLTAGPCAAGKLAEVRGRAHGRCGGHLPAPHLRAAQCAAPAHWLMRTVERHDHGWRLKRCMSAEPAVSAMRLLLQGTLCYGAQVVAAKVCL